jgi:ribosomal protein S25
MGGAKKKSISQSEKAQQAPVEETAGKKVKEGKRMGGKETKRMDWSVPKLSDEQAIQTLGPLKAITTYEAARVLGVKASVAVAVLRNLENRGRLKREAGYSGHLVYSLSSLKPNNESR